MATASYSTLYKLTPRNIITESMIGTAIVTDVTDRGASEDVDLMAVFLKHKQIASETLGIETADQAQARIAKTQQLT